MFENYIEEQQTLLPYLRMYSKQFPSIEIPKIGTYGYNWDESRVKHNVGKWCEEIKICSKDIQYAYCFSKAYNDLIKRYLDDMASQLFPRGYELRSFELHFWIMSLLEQIYSFREKVAHLIFDLYDQNLSYTKCGDQVELNHDIITFFKTLTALKDFQGSIQWIPKADHQKVVLVFKSFCNGKIKELFEIRHRFLHRAKPAIDTTGTGPIIVGGEQVDNNVFSIYLLQDKDYSYQKIEHLFIECWEIIRKGTQDILLLDCFK